MSRKIAGWLKGPSWLFMINHKDSAIPKQKENEEIRRKVARLWGEGHFWYFSPSHVIIENFTCPYPMYGMCY